MNFELKDQKYIELLKLLKLLNLVGSGGEAKIRIDDGEAIVNGNVEFRRRNKLRRGDKIEFAGTKITII